MVFNELYKLQAELDKTIHKQHKTNYKETMERRIMAFIVELGEFANETRCFKYWSLKGPSPKDIILEEYIDGIHFILSLGIAMKCDINKDYEVDNTKEDLTSVFLDVYKLTSVFKDNQTLDNYYTLFTRFLKLGYLCGFNMIDIHEAYLRKNKINYKRQETNY